MRAKKGRFILLAVIVIAVIAVICIAVGVKSRDRYYVTQYGDDDMTQIMFYVIEDTKGHLAVVDGGTGEYEDFVRSVLAKKGNHVDAWILTHPHIDHMEAFNRIYADPQGVSIDAVYTTEIPEDLYDAKAEDTYDDRETYDTFERQMSDADNLYYLHKGDELDLIGLNMKVYSACSDDFWDYTFSYDLPNAASLVFKLTHKKESILFLGDCEESMERFMDVDDMGAYYVQMAHHGQNMSLEFYAKLGFSVAFFDSPEWLRSGETYKTKEKMEWCEAQGIEILSFDTTPNTVELR